MMIEAPNWSVKCRKIQPKTSILPHWKKVEHLALNRNRCPAERNTNGKSLATVIIINFLSCLLTKARNNFLTVVLFVCSYNLTNCHGHTISRCTTKKLYYVSCSTYCSSLMRPTTSDAEFFSQKFFSYYICLYSVLSE